MNKKLKKMWVKALLSGYYKQWAPAAGYKDANGKFCCLGVLYDLMPNRMKTRVMTRTNILAAGLPSEIQDQLVILNDGDESAGIPPMPFEMIAGLIEEAL